MPFRITGIGSDGLQTATRIQAASAIVLASKWIERGFSGVLVAEGDRQPETVEHMRIRLYRRPVPTW